MVREYNQYMNKSTRESKGASAYLPMSEMQES